MTPKMILMLSMVIVGISKGICTIVTPEVTNVTYALASDSTMTHIVGTLNATNNTSSLSATVISNITNVTSLLALSSTATQLFSILAANTKSKSNLSNILTETSNYPLPMSNPKTPPSFDTSINVDTIAKTSCLFTITCAATSLPSFTVLIVTPTPTAYGHSEDKETASDSSTGSHTVLAAKAWISKLSSITEICHRYLNTLLELYHIKLTIAFLRK